ncbi:MAG: sigma-70 family RNA polymerase sigma factor [Chloroflexi bacterium]|nr:MAG: sigma-70 family RNA polymerase sigma factor [Chloroflexota bacterium]
MTNTEQPLIQALRQRNPEAFTQVFNQYSDKIYRLAIGLLNNEDEAEGIVQETFMRLIEHIDQFEGRSQIGTWLYRVAYNLCIDHLRKQQPNLTLAEEHENSAKLPQPVILTNWHQPPEKLLASEEIMTQLDKAIESLSPTLRAVFILREIEGLSTAETAQILNLTPGTVKVRLHRARLQLREQLAAYFAEQTA